MRKKSVALMLSAMAVLSLVGCGTAKNSMDVKYNVDDYVTLGDYKNLDVTVTGDYEVGEDDVNQYIDQMIAYYAPYVSDDAQQTVTANSVVNVDYVGTKDGVAFDGGSDQDVFIDVATNTNAVQKSGYIDGFSSALVGARVGDTVDAQVTFPAEYQEASLAGQEVTFTFTVNYIAKAMTRELLDDAYVAANFGMNTVDEYKTQTQGYVIAAADNGKASDTREAVMAKVQENAKCDKVPENLLTLRVEEYIAEYEETYCKDTTLEKYLDSTYGVTVDDFKSQVQTTVEENIKVELIFEAIAKKEKIELDDEGFANYVKNLMSSADAASEEALYEMYGADAKAGQGYLERIYICNKACDVCVDSAKVTYEAPKQ